MILSCLLFVLNFSGPDSASPAPVWPPPPDRARIRHVQTIASSADLHVESGFFEKLIGALFGGRDRSPWLVQPVGIAVSGRGVLVIADPGAQGIHIIDQEKKSYRLVTETSSGFLVSPVAVAFSSDGTLSVTDSQ